MILNDKPLYLYVYKLSERENSNAVFKDFFKKYQS